MIPYGRQEVTQADLDEVLEVLTSDFLTQGPKGLLFEEKVAQYCDSKFAVSVNSATSALHIACKALGLREGEHIWTTPITFVASANCALYCGASFELIDIDPVTFNICPDKLAERLRLAKKEASLPRILIAVHMAGQPCDMERIYRLCSEYGVSVIEDASHAIGARYSGRPVGCCEHSEITVFSFHPVKIITTAEGGMAVTNDPNLAQRMRLLRSHGITRDEKEMQREPDGPWYYEQIDLGFNYRMTDVQAALGISQLDRLDQYVERRNKIAQRYNEAFSDCDLKTPKIRENCLSAYHLYIIRVEASIKRSFFAHLREGGLGVNLHYIPLYKHPYFSSLCINEKDFPEAERYYNEAISIPMHPSLSEDDVTVVIEKIKSTLKFLS